MKSPVDAYAETQRAALTGRALEAAVLLKAAQKLDAARRTLESGASLDMSALLNNRRLWEILLLSATDAQNPLPYETKRSIANIGVFVLGHTFDQMAKPTAEGLNALIRINRSLADGLSSKPAAMAAQR